MNDEREARLSVGKKAVLPKIAFVTMSKRGPDAMHTDASVQYRCVNPARALRRLGCGVTVHHARAVPEKLAADFVIVHRPRQSSDFRRLLGLAKGSVVWSDVDDLLFSESALAEHPAYLSGTASKRVLRVEVRKSRDALEQVGQTLVATTELARHHSETLPGLRNEVIHNGWDEMWRALGGGTATKSDSRIINYFAGTKNHLDDLREHSAAINKFVSQRIDVVVHVYGSIDPSEIAMDPQRWRAVPSMPFHELPRVIAAGWACLAPLRPTPFNLCKSGIKLIESGLFGVPLIASQTPELKEFPDGCVCFADLSEDWWAALEGLSDSVRYAQVSESARAASSEWSALNSAEKLLSHLGVPL